MRRTATTTRQGSAARGQALLPTIAPLRLRRLGATLAAGTLIALAAAGAVRAVAAQPPAPALAGTTVPAPRAAAAAPTRTAATAPRAAADAKPYGLAQLWRRGDGVTRCVLLALLALSLASWYVIVAKLIEQGLLARQARRVAARFWLADDVTAAAAELTVDSPYHQVAAAALQAETRHRGLHARVDFADWIDLCLARAVERAQRRMSSGLSLLATVGSTSPFIGLFGTVWGIEHALTSIALSGHAGIDQVAGPVGSALVMTALGLAAAVPAVLGYNALLRRHAMLLGELRDFAGELHSAMLAPRACA